MKTTTTATATTTTSTKTALKVLLQLDHRHRYRHHRRSSRAPPPQTSRHHTTTTTTGCTNYQGRKSNQPSQRESSVTKTKLKQKTSFILVNKKNGEIIHSTQNTDY